MKQAGLGININKFNQIRLDIIKPSQSLLFIGSTFNIFCQIRLDSIKRSQSFLICRYQYTLVRSDWILSNQSSHCLHIRLDWIPYCEASSQLILFICICMICLNFEEYCFILTMSANTCWLSSFPPFYLELEVELRVKT